MDDIKRKVARAHRRLVMQQFLTIFSWSMFAVLLTAVVGLAIPKIWPLGVESDVWLWSWVGGSAFCGLFLSIICTMIVRRSVLEAAIEIDRRFGLKERVSSTLSLSNDDLSSEAGQALMKDAIRRVGRIDVGEQFQVRGNWRMLLPLAPALAIFALAFFVPDAISKQAQAKTASDQEQKVVKSAAELLKKKAEEQKKKIEEQGLKEAEFLIKKLEKAAEDMANKKSEVDKKKSMLKLNELAKEIEKRREELGDSNELRKQLDKMKDLKQGPAEKLAKAMQKGEFDKAIDEVSKLAEKLKKGELSKEEMEKLAEQLKQMQDKLQEMAEAHEQAKRDLEEQIKQKMDQGDMAAAGKLQRQLDKLNQQNQQMSQMQQMASKLGEAQQAMQDAMKDGGDMQMAAQKLSELTDSLEELQENLDELQTLSEMMDQLADAKNAMNCEGCNGMGCAMCQGMGMGNMMGDPGYGLGEGQGRGDRPEEEHQTGKYDTQVRDNELGAGASIVSGVAGGKNQAGQTLEEIKQEIAAGVAIGDDAIEDLKLPKAEKNQLRQYFNQIQGDE